MALGFVAAGTNRSAAAIIAENLGLAAPPAMLGGFSLTPFAADGRPLGQPVGSVPSPTAFGGEVTFSTELDHLRIGQGWLTWSHGYTGDVYHDASVTDLTMALPTGTRAFVFYAQPGPLEDFNIIATAHDGTSLTLVVNGEGGALGFGFYSDTVLLQTIRVQSDVDFAVGEFLITQVPEPEAWAGMTALGLAGLAGAYRWRARRTGRRL